MGDARLSYAKICPCAHLYVRWFTARAEPASAAPACAGFGFTVLAMALGFSQSLHAQSASWSGTAALSSQLIDRGLAITPDTPSLQGALAWTSASGWSFGVSGSTELRTAGHVTQAIAEASRYWRLSADWQMQTSLLYYDYPGNSGSKVYDRSEAGVSWIYRDVLTFGLSAARLNGGQDHQPRGAADLDLHWPLPWHMSLSAGAGIAQTLIVPDGNYPGSHSNHYSYGHAGLIWNYGAWRLELDRIAADIAAQRQGGGPSAAPWVATLSRSF